MTIAGLILTSLFRDPRRSVLNLTSLSIAFLLFTLHQMLSAAFSGELGPTQVDRLYIIKAQLRSGSLSMPVAHGGQIRRIEGIKEVTPLINFRGYYREPADSFKIEPIEAATYFSVFPEWAIPTELLDRFAATRTGALVTKPLADRYGWQPGDRINFTSTLWPKEDGAWSWEFDYLGSIDPLSEHDNDRFRLFFRYAYFNETVWIGSKDLVRTWVASVDDFGQLMATGHRIDAHFQGSPDATHSTTYDELVKETVRQLGDIALITTAIILAVFVSLILLIGNTLMQSVRERTPEFAVMRTIGFTPAAVALLCACEAVALCLMGGVLGVASALMLEPLLAWQLAPVIGHLAISAQVITTTVVLSLLFGLAIGTIPAFAVYRLTVTQALRVQ